MFKVQATDETQWAKIPIVVLMFWVFKLNLGPKQGTFSIFDNYCYTYTVKDHIFWPCLDGRMAQSSI